MEMPQGWLKLRRNHIQQSDVINAADLMKEMAEALKLAAEEGRGGLRGFLYLEILKKWREWK